MPRPGQPPASTLRNRNRITNKSRLKIVHGNIDVDPIIPDEDEEKNRLLQSVAGVDQEDANEHHLQAVLSEAALQAGRATKKESAAFIPIPDHAGVADNYETLYPAGRWKDPVSYVQFSSVIEDYCAAALADGCTYYMDERDKEWLERNNEEARGEGTSAQGSVSTSSGRISSRSAKAKGKEPEDLHSVLMSEDEFELVMGLFEKITQEKTAFLHHSLQSTPLHFPEFSEYQEVLSIPLPPATFAAFTLPSWLPQPPQLVRLARVVYPYWKERCLERAGHRIIPTLNFDESDTLNESYVCFRRRETKTVRKTRASQVTSSDKLARLQSEFEGPIQLAKHVLSREQFKRDASRQSQAVWEARMKLVDLKVQNPTLGDKLDDELLVDKERPSKKADSSRVRLPTKPDAAIQPPPPPRDILRPKERQALYHTKIETMLQKQKDLDQHWEDHVDSGYIPPLAPYASRLFKYINPSERPKRALSQDPDSDSDAQPAQKRPIRVRHGRGGRIFIDRRVPSTDVPLKRRRRISVSDDEDDSMDVDAVEDDPEADRRLAERWRFDADDSPPHGPGGADEHDRVLVDDFDLKYMNRTVSLLSEADLPLLLNDPTISRITSDGKKETILPFRLGMVPPPKGAPGRGYVSLGAQQGQPQVPIAQQVPNGAPNGMPVHQGVPISQQLKMPPSSSNANNARPPSNGHSANQAAVSIPSQAPVAGVPVQSSSPRPPAVIPAPQVTHNGRPAMNMPRVDMMKLAYNHNSPSNYQKAEQHSSPDNDAQLQPEQIPRPKSQQQVHMQSSPQEQGLTAVNGLHPGYAALTTAAYNMPAYNFLPHPYSTNSATSGLNAQQVQNLKSVFNASNAGAAQNYTPAMFAQLQMPKNANPAVNGAGVSNNGVPNMQNMQNLQHMNLKLPAVRQMQRTPSGTSANGVSPPRPGSTVNGAPHGMANSPSPHMTHAGEHVPVRTPSANGSRAGMRGQMPHTQMQQQMMNGQMNGQIPQQMLQNVMHSQSPQPSYNSPQSYSLSPSPAKMQPASMPGVGSPMMQQQQQQQQQVVGSQGVY